jgi:TolB protein
MFQAPAWLEDGRTAVAVITDGPDAALARLDDAGNVLQKLATSRAGMLFVMSPSRELVAYVPLSIGGAGNLRIVGVDGNGDREAIATPVLTFLWSPDSTKLAFLTTASETDRTVAFKGQATLTLRWNVLDLPTGEARALKSFEPTEAFLNLLPFFDQYAQSIRLWDQASGRLVYADPAGVWTLDVVSGEAALIDEGVLGMWMEH